MRCVCLVAVCYATTALARPATGPVDVRPVPLVGQAIDPRQPAFVPKFAEVRHPLDLHYPERQYAMRYGYPGLFDLGLFGGYGYGGWGYGDGFGGYGFGGYGPQIVTGFGQSGSVGGYSR